MNLDLFNLLEDHSNEIATRVKEQIRERLPVYEKFSDGLLQDTIERCLEGYIDLVVTGEADSLDRQFRLLSRLMAHIGGEFREVFAIPLLISSVARGIVAEKFERAQDSNGFEKYTEALNEIEENAHTAACRFLDVFQEFFDKRIEDNNAYIRDVEREFGIDLKEFRMDPKKD